MDFVVHTFQTVKDAGAALYNNAKSIGPPDTQTFLKLATVSTIPGVAGQTDVPDPSFWQSNLFIGITTGTAVAWLLCSVGIGYCFAKCCAQSDEDGTSPRQDSEVEVQIEMPRDEVWHESDTGTEVTGGGSDEDDPLNNHLLPNSPGTVEVLRRAGLSPTTTLELI